MFGHKALCEFYGLLFRVAQILNRDKLLPYEIGQKNDFTDRTLVHFVHNVLKKLIHFILPLQVDNQPLFLNFRKEGSMLPDSFGQIPTTIVALLQIEYFPLQPLWFEAPQHVLLVFHIFRELFLETALVLIHVRLLETDIKGICQDLDRSGFVFFLLGDRGLCGIEQQALDVIDIGMQKVLGMVA
jgi:hypothetical protein